MLDGSTTTIIRDDITKAKAILLVTVAVLHTAAHYLVYRLVSLRLELTWVWSKHFHCCLGGVMMEPHTQPFRDVC